MSPRGYGVSARTDVSGRVEVSARVLSPLQDWLSGVGSGSVGAVTGVPGVTCSQETGNMKISLISISMDRVIHS